MGFSIFTQPSWEWSGWGHGFPWNVHIIFITTISRSSWLCHHCFNLSPFYHHQNPLNCMCVYIYIYTYTYMGFPKMRVPQNHPFQSPYKPSIFGYPHLWKPPWLNHMKSALYPKWINPHDHWSPSHPFEKTQKIHFFIGFSVDFLPSSELGVPPVDYEKRHEKTMEKSPGAWRRLDVVFSGRTARHARHGVRHGVQGIPVEHGAHGNRRWNSESDALLTGAFHAGNGWEWGLLGLSSLKYHSDHSRKFPDLKHQ